MKNLFMLSKQHSVQPFFSCEDELGGDPYNDGTNSSAGITETTQRLYLLFGFVVACR